MSGMVGIFHRNGSPVDCDLLQRSTSMMIRRGPDAQRIWADGPVGFGHAALFTTLEAEREHQPTTLDGQVWITADARIDEWEHLRRNLSAKGQTIPDTVTDVELILHAYHVWGEDCVNHLIGDFSFVIWDARQQKLFCARDHMGVKPFYYYLSDKLFVFASEVRALLAMPDVPHRINESRIADFLVEQLEGIDKTSTFYLDIFRLPPAQIMIVDRDQRRVRTYWELDPHREIRLGSDDEYAEAFLEIFTEAVRCRLRSPERVGSMLSGGLDSSSVVGVARKLLHENGHGPLRTFSAMSDDEKNDVETHYIKIMLNESGLKPWVIRPQELGEIIDDIYSITGWADDPDDFPVIIPQAMYFGARSQNVKVLLDGVAGDFLTLLSSNYLAVLIKERHIRNAVREIRAVYSPDIVSVWRPLLKYTRAAIVPDPLRRLKRQLLRKKRLDAILEETLIHPEFAHRNLVLSRVDTWQDFTKMPQNIGQEHLNWLSHPALVNGLERYDRIASYYSIEARHPYTDKRLVEFGLALPWSQKISQGWLKIINRRAMAGVLPDEVRWRPVRAHLASQFGPRCFSLGYTKLSAILSNDALYEMQKYIDVPKIQNRFQAPPSERTLDFSFQMMGLASLVLWMHRNSPNSIATNC